MIRKYSLYAIIIMIVSLLISCDSETSEIQTIEENFIVDKRIELLSGVLSHTSWMDSNGPKGQGNLYFQELKEFFSDYKNHDAISIAEELTVNGFVYGGPVIFVLSLGEFPNLEKLNDYDESLKGRNVDLELLEEFRIALIDLAKVSNFDEFYNNHQSDYNEYLLFESKEFDFIPIKQWMEDFYGYSQGDYMTILAPAMFPDGGYGILTKKEDGGNIAYHVVRDSGQSGGTPKFYIDYVSSSVHEFGHSYVNSLTDTYNEMIYEYHLDDLYERIEGSMQKMAYGNPESFFNEQIIRSITALAIRDLKGEKEFNESVNYSKLNSFYLTDTTIEQLEKYMSNRDIYPTFNDFYPILLKSYFDNKDTFLD